MALPSLLSLPSLPPSSPRHRAVIVRSNLSLSLLRPHCHWNFIVISPVENVHWGMREDLIHSESRFCAAMDQNKEEIRRRTLPFLWVSLRLFIISIHARDNSESEPESEPEPRRWQIRLRFPDFFVLSNAHWSLGPGFGDQSCWNLYNWYTKVITQLITR